MKKIEAIVDAEHVEKVSAALETIGVQGVLATEVRGFIRKRVQPAGLGLPSKMYFAPKWKLDISVVDAHLRHAAQAIFATANTRVIVDGKLFLEDMNAELAP